MAIISRSFSGRRSAADAKLPPGQYLTTDFPVLSAGPTPHTSLDRWEFTIDDGSNVLKRWDWKSFRELPSEDITVDLHCVTQWSKLGTSWEGVSLDVLLAVHSNDFTVQPNTEIALLLEKLEKITRLGVWRDGNPESNENGVLIRRLKVGAFDLNPAPAVR